MRRMAESAWVCGDPGMQFDTTVNDWHPCPNTARINASNPCSEYMFLDDSACNLASLNLMKFYSETAGFDVEAYRAALRVVITAQEIVVGFASYPTEAIGKNSHAFRPLGIGYANLGALLMARGVPYDSEEGRQYAAAITSILSGESYAQSARIAEKIGPFEGYAVNEQPFLRVIDKHRRSAYRIDVRALPAELAKAACDVWDEAYALGQQHGYRNAQISVLAPTGTIAFMMDCDTTGIEPDIALVKYKKLVGGGMLKLVNQTVPTALKRLGYDAKQVKEIVEYISENDTIEGAPHVIEQHLTVFDCAFKPANGTRSIHYMGHLKMMGAVQPFISGAISKTINMPNNATVEEIEGAYYEAWKMGLKAVAVYRDGCKRSQPLSTGKEKQQLEQLGVAPTAVRRKLPDERESITHKFSIGGHEGYITVGKYEDGSPGEIFITMAKEGSTISGLMDSFATMTSLALQHGVPLQLLVDKFTHLRFEPSGFTKNPEIPMAKSIMDYLFKWLAIKFLTREAQEHAGVILRDDAATATYEAASAPKVSNVTTPTASDLSFIDKVTTATPPPVTVSDSSKVVGFVMPAKNADGANPGNKSGTFLYQQDAPSCSDCGEIMVRNGACYKCLNCGSTSGCS
jgi:ribonucleoside-diphosphate reductase alpha chain